EYLATEMGFGSGMTCWRRLRDWNEAGVWQRLHEALLAGLDVASRLDWSRRVVDSSHVRALKEGIHTGPSPVDRGQAGSKHHLITDGRGTPLAVILTGGNRNDVTQLLPLLDAIPPVRAGSAVPAASLTHCSPTADTTTTSTATRFVPAVPCPSSPAAAHPHGSGLGVYRWVVERTFAWPHGFPRLRVRWERRADIHEALRKLACYLITH
ncbi:IS5 family transposase, partial [Streptomyces azureus]|uniref:IS5 family transposase n=1 Tax=Streptomyces azureus TaxID=146537 RepID=UPI000AD6A7F4